MMLKMGKREKRLFWFERCPEAYPPAAMELMVLGKILSLNIYITRWETQSAYGMLAKVAYDGSLQFSLTSHQNRGMELFV